jgi:hypothetical protein
MRRTLSAATLVAIIVLGLLVAMRFPRTAAAQNAGAQDPPLSFGNNFFVTGDYVVAGAQNLNASFGNDGFGTGIISFPDGNRGIRGTTTVPKGANIVAALLYWQTVEKVGAPGSGQNGFFGPVLTVNGKPQPQLYAISGVNLPNHNSTSFSNGGCSGTSTGKIVQTYRADVRSFLPRDANGNVLVDSADGVTFEVRLPNVGNNTPLTLGASLVLIYRVLSPNFPLNVITIYDGGFAANTAPNFTMSQLIQGPTQVANSPVSRLTHIVGAGKSNKFQQAFLGGGQGANQRATTALPSPYGNGQPAFPGFYTNWDTTTWVFPDPTFPNHPNLANPLQENDDSATTTVVASGATPGCVSWGATILSTTIHDDDKDGIPPIWKANKGYTDVGTGQFVSLDDPGDEPKPGQQDVFIQLDHVVDPTGDYSPKAGVESAVKAAFLAHNHNIHLHITDKYPIQWQACSPDNFNVSPPQLCPYPNQPGVTTFPDGFEGLKNQLVDPTGNPGPCTAVPTPANCSSRFPLAERNSHHYVIFGDALGGVNWALLGGTLTGSTGTGAGVVQQKGNTVTFYSARGHGLTVSNSLGNGRVTITGAITNPSLNGTYLVTSFTCPPNPATIPPTGLPDCSLENKAAGPYIFTVRVGGNPTVSTYTLATDPNLAVASGQAGTGSGVSFIGGGDTLVTLGLWGAKNTAPAQEGTFMHELGHTLALTHGGYYYDNLAANQNPPDYRPTIEPNCKSNYQTVMNYMFQTALLGPNGALDFSSQQLNVLNEHNLPKPGSVSTAGGVPIAFPTTDWYDTKQTFAVKTANITSFSIHSNVVTFQAANTFTAGNTVNVTGLTVGSYLNGQVLTVISTGLSSTQFEANFAHADVALTADSGTAATTTQVAIGTAATHRCDGSPLASADPPEFFYEGGTTPFPGAGEIDNLWLSTMLDVNFDGTIQATNFRGYNDWANTDPRQVGASGSILLGPGGLFTGPGGFFTGPGGLFTGPGGFFTGPGGFFTGPGGFFTGPGGFFTGPGGLFTGPGGFFTGPGVPGISGGEIDLKTTLSVTHRPNRPMATENPSPRVIHLSWTPPTYFDSFNIYRSADGGNTFSLIANTANTFFDDTVSCNPTGFQYFITTVLTTGVPTPQESLPSDTVSTGQSGQLLTGCYISTANTAATITLPGFSSPAAGATFTPSDAVNITWTLLDASNNQNFNVGDFPTANKALVLIGPLPSPSHDNSCAALGLVPVFLQSPGSYAGPNPFAPVMPLAGITANNGQFMATWNTGESSAGCYVIELDTDSGQYERVEVQLLIDVNDTDSTPHVATVALTAGTVGLAYNNTLTEDGGTAPFQWTFSNGLPLGISQQSQFSPTLTGTTCAAGSYNFTAMVTDSKSNFGTQPLTLQINKANTTTGVISNASPSVFQQMVTFTVTVAPQYSCTPTGTVTLFDGGIPIASNLMLTNGMATFMTSSLSVGMHNITASYSGDPNFNPSNSNSAPLSQTVNKANTSTTITLVSPSPAVVG